MLRKLGAVVFALGVSGAQATTYAEASTTDQVAGPQYEHFVLHLINVDRRTASIPRVASSLRLSELALAHSMDMAKDHYFSHFTPNGESPTDRLEHSRIGFRVNGENLGWDSGQAVPVMLKAIEVAMLSSPEHRDILLERSFRHVGVGVVINRDEVFVTEDFTG
jgi:uncharacterized protein YkwD